MNRASTITLSAIVILAVIIAFFIYELPKLSFHAVPALSAAVVTVDTSDQDVRAQVAGFGAALKDVSVLAPGTEFQREMEAAYGTYVTPELIAQWELDPAEALGRSPSSPSPDHIDITSIARRSDGDYAVSGTVVDDSNANSYPIALILMPIGDTWFIANGSKPVSTI